MEHSKELALKQLTCKVRLNIIDSIYNAQSGHPGGSLSIAELLVYLYEEILNINPKEPYWSERDRFILSKGHAAPALYSILSEKGYFDKNELLKLRKIDGILQGHPDMKGIPGVDMSTGSLGQGFSTAVGMALGAKMFNEKYKVYCILGDGELQEGQIWEAAMLAGNKSLNNLLAIVDNNNLQIDGTVEEINSPYPIDEKFKAFGWAVYMCDAHDFQELEKIFDHINFEENKPVAIIASSIKGKGISFMENNVSWHGSPPSTEQYELAIKELKTTLQELGGMAI
jgi:Transketolase, N-terminal subunit